jgi:dolichyl-phosphate-mannose-protein mannosyltransferase
MSQTQQVRQRGPKDAKRPQTPIKDAAAVLNGKFEDTLASLKVQGQDVKKSDWDHSIAFTIITLLGFITRFWGISHPDQVVFDEVHFGKVYEPAVAERRAMSPYTRRVLIRTTSSQATTSNGATFSTSTSRTLAQ